MQTQSAARRFDPTDVGTPEHDWQVSLSSTPAWSPRPGRLIVVSAHPDDEILGAGGLMHTWAAAGHPITVVSVTDGEAAFPAWRGLDLVRRGELKGALRKLCPTHVTVVRIGLPDGGVARYANRLRNALLSLLDTGVTLLAPFERDGHSDHEVVGSVCCSLRNSQGVTLARYPIRTWHHTHPSEFGAAHWGRFPLTFDARRAKARAVQCFHSQLHPPDARPVVPAHVLAHFERPYEAFLL